MLLLSLLLIPENGKIQAAVPCAYGKIHPTCPASGEGDALAAAVGVPIYLYAVPEYLRAYSVIDLSDWGLNVETGGNLRSSEREFPAGRTSAEICGLPSSDLFARMVATCSRLEFSGPVPCR